MTLEQQVTSLEISKRLKELGVKQGSIFVWQQPTKWHQHEVIPKPRIRKQLTVSAFTVAELGEMLPKNENIVTMFFSNGHCQIAFQDTPFKIGKTQVSRWGAAGQGIEAPTEADARGKMLIYLLENHLITL